MSTAVCWKHFALDDYHTLGSAAVCLIMQGNSSLQSCTSVIGSLRRSASDVHANCSRVLVRNDAQHFIARSGGLARVQVVTVRKKEQIS